jgi:hypothetical protein
MNYKSIFLLIAVLAATSTVGFSQSLFEQWPSLKTFHGVMSETFHPAEEGNLAPIKERSSEMAEKAADLAKSAIPQAFQKPAMMTTLKKLKKDSKALDKMVKSKAGDPQITQSLSALHDVFHEIVGLCKDEK